MQRCAGRGRGDVDRSVAGRLSDRPRLDACRQEPLRLLPTYPLLLGEAGLGAFDVQVGQAGSVAVHLADGPAGASAEAREADETLRHRDAQADPRELAGSAMNPRPNGGKESAAPLRHLAHEPRRQQAKP